MSAPEAAVDRLPEDAYLLALLHLEKLGPVRLTDLLSAGSPSTVWEYVRRGEVPADLRLRGVAGTRSDLLNGWRTEARDIDPARCWAHQHRSGHAMFRRGDDNFPERLANDPEPPELLFVRGTLPAAEVPTVAVVGTRHCSVNGNRVAEQLGMELASSGVSVVSGLARGIDAAAHRGAMRAVGGAPPIAVVATGLDLSYPRSTASLAEEVAGAGAIVSEYPLGTAATKWRFPARNRIVAGLADAVVVVESARTGGSMHTVHEASERGVPVFAVPGPVSAAASEGTNALLFDGCAIVRDARDVLEYLGLSSLFRPETTPSDDVETATGADPVLDAVDWWPTSIDDLCQRTGLGLGPLSVRLEALARSGHVVSHGSSFERRR